MTSIDQSDSGFVSPQDVSSQWVEITLLQARSHSILYRAKRYGRWFVLKGLPPAQQHLTDSLILQDKEFRLGLQLVHPNIVATYSIETVPDCGRCIVMEAVDGQNLDRWLATKPDRPKRTRVLYQLLDAVEYLHARQLVHHDLKPSNILITHNGENLKLIDFGLSNTDDAATVVPNNLQDDLVPLADLMTLFRLRSMTSVIRRCKRGRYRNIAELRADLSRRERVARGVYVVLMVAMLLLCLGLSWQAFHEHQLARQALEETQKEGSIFAERQKLAQQALEDAQKERSIFEQERQKQEEIQREQERRKQAVIADVNAIYDREEQRLNKMIRHEKYSEFAITKFFIYNRYQVLADSLNRVYPASDAVISYLCNTICTQRWQEHQKEVMKQADQMPSFPEEYQQGRISAEEYRQLMVEYNALSGSSIPYYAR